MKSIVRCAWANGHPLLAEYHDAEWGLPVRNDRAHYEFLVLEAAQAGLSWLTVLKKRDGYRRHFANFDFNKVAEFGEAEIKVMMKDPDIIRNDLKIRSAITNARAFLAVRSEFKTFDRYLRTLAGEVPIVNSIRSIRDIQPSSPLSDKVSKDLKKRGFKFVGTTVIYAHLQAVGIVNDHEDACFRKKICVKAARCGA